VIDLILVLGYNHFARDCQASGVKCYNCGKFGHIVSSEAIYYVADKMFYILSLAIALMQLTVIEPSRHAIAVARKVIFQEIAQATM
jgi:hypothetical protein